MAEKRVSVRLAATGGRQVRAELEGVGEAGKRGFGRLSQEMEAANKRLAGFARRVRVAAAAAVAATVAAGVAMVRSGLQTVDAQAKLAASLDTTVASIQVLERAAELSGARFSEIEGGASRLTRRLSLFASDGGGPAAAAIERLGLNAGELLRLPLDARIDAVTRAIRETADASEQAALFSQLFPGDTPGQPVKEIRRFWIRVQKEANLHDVRIHDLRHTFASLMVSGGASLEMIGKLLGHSQMHAIQRYAHLMDSPLRDGVDAVAGMFRPRPKIVHDADAKRA